MAFLNGGIRIDSPAKAMAKTAHNHTNVVAAILVKSSTVAISSTVKILALLDCVVVGNHTHNTVGLAGADLELPNYGCIIELFRAKVDSTWIEIDGDSALLNNFLNGHRLQFFPIFQRNMLFFGINTWCTFKQLFKLYEILLLR